MNPNDRWAVGAVVLTFALASGCSRDHAGSADAPASKLPPPSVPDNLKAGDGEIVTAKLAAKGAQIYECQVGDNGAYAWKLVGPDAELTDDTGKHVGTHYAGPTWESVDGSKVVAEVKAKADAPAGPGSVPWLLLKAKSTSGTGTFGKVTSVQRVDTAGGTPSVGGCDVQHLGAQQRADYKATYYFYSPRG